MYQFDKVFYNATTEQSDIYNFSAKDTIEDILNGYNGTIFAYGQTGAGKSFTMFGPEGGSETSKGIIPRACKHIFDRIEVDESGTEYILKCSFLEIYKENIRDLLDRDKVNLKVRETPSRGVWVQDLTEHFVSCVEDIFYLLEVGEKSRAVSSTKMNSVSSRSHSLFILSLSQKNIDGSTKEGKLNLADLAGSEKVGKTGATGDTLEEAKKINQSLSALGNCINALTKSKKGHVPYRDSKLTHILRESLGGNSKTTLIIACSPHSFNIDETISTLKFGQRAKSIKNVVKINQQRSVKELEAIVENLTKELNLLRAYVASLEDCILSIEPNFDLAALKKKALATLQVSTTEEGSSTPSKSSGDSDSSPFSPAPEIFDPSYNPAATAEFQFKLEQMKEKYQLEIQDLKDEIDKLRSISGSEGEYDYNSLTLQVSSYMKELEELKSELKMEHIRQSQKDYEFEKKMLELDSTSYKLTSNKESLEQKISDMETQKKLLLDEREFLLDQNIEIKKEFDAIAIELSSRESKYAELQIQNEQLHLEHIKAKEENESNKSRTSELEAQLEELRTSFFDVTKSLKEKEIEFISKVKELELLEQSFNDEEKAEKQLQNELLEIQKHNSSMELDFKKKNHDLQTMRDLLESKNQEIEAAKDTIGKLEKSLEEKRLQVSDREAHLVKTIDTLEESIREEKSKREKAEAESRHLAKKLFEQDSFLKESKDSLEKLQKESTTNNILMTKQLTHANNRIAELMKEIANLLETSEEHKEKADKYRKEYEVASNWNIKENRTSIQRDRVVVPIKGGKRSSKPKRRRTLVDIFFSSKEQLPTRKELDKSNLKGTLWKQVFLGRWSQKWFILLGHNLYYFDSKDSAKADGVIQVDGCSVKIKQTNNDDRYKYLFMLSHPARETVNLCALTEAQMLHWVEIIDYISTMNSEDAETICTANNSQL